MDAVAMTDFCRANGIRLLIDAAHPFAEQLHRTIAGVSERLQLPVIRYDRIYPQRDARIIWCRDYPDAIGKLRERQVTRLLALTGVQTIGELKSFWQHTDTWFRILDREASRDIATRQGFPPERLLFYHTGDDDARLIGVLRPDALLLKESGTSGGFTEKVTAAREYGIPVFAIERPPMPGAFRPVDGKHGLRRAVEQLLPEFYPLRTGVTTGSCATAAAVAALIRLLTDEERESAVITLPDGEHLSIPVRRTVVTGDAVSCTVIKDSGDDADVTHGVSIVADVRLLPAATPSAGAPPAVIILGGEGVGRVTLPGLGLEIGSAAINAAPRKMITENLQAIYRAQSPRTPHDIEVRLSVPKGEEIARRTFNPRLGVVGGISIIGTSGIVQPFSVEAFIASIRKSMEVARASGADRVVINSGAKSERYLRDYYAGLPDAAFVHYGNYIGEALKIASGLGINRVTLGIMTGKAVKLAEGHLDTHSKKITMNKTFLASIAREAGCRDRTADAITGITLARELWTVIPANERPPFFSRLIRLCHAHCDPLLPNGVLTILLVSEDGEALCYD